MMNVKLEKEAIFFEIKNEPLEEERDDNDSFGIKTEPCSPCQIDNSLEYNSTVGDHSILQEIQGMYHECPVLKPGSESYEQIIHSKYPVLKLQKLNGKMLQSRAKVAKRSLEYSSNVEDYSEDELKQGLNQVQSVLSQSSERCYETEDPKYPVQKLQDLGRRILRSGRELYLEEIDAVKTEGRPMPEIRIAQPGISNNKKYIRGFNPEWYGKKDWLCGCEVKNALFCFPCLLLGGDSTWTKSGFTNINKLKEKTERHERSKKHIDNVISLSLLGKVNIKQYLSEANKLSIIEHNNKVTKNRQILSKIINCIKFSGNFEMDIGHGKRDSNNPSVFEKLISFSSELDPDLKRHLESNVAFKDFSSTVQNDVLDCVLQVSRNQIKKEVEKASFLAVMVNETSDVSEKAQIVIVLRYELNEEVFERFWGFFYPESDTAEGISKCILDQLDILLEVNKRKLIAQVFDGLNIMKEKKSEILSKINEVYTNAHTVHSYAHKPDLIMKTAASTTRNSRIFFCNLISASAFFTKAPLRLSVLISHIYNSIPCPSSRKRNNKSIVNFVRKNFESFKTSLEEIQSTAKANHTIAGATVILHILNNENFMFWLRLFHELMPHVETIYNQMKSGANDSPKVQEYITNFSKAILKIRNSESCKNLSEKLMTEAKEVCDSLCDDIAKRFSFTAHLVAANLLTQENFYSYNTKTPVEEVNITTNAFPMIEKEKLLSELQVFYSRSDIHSFHSLLCLLRFISENHLTSVLGELTKLIKLILTIPMTTSDAKRCPSTFKKVKTFLKRGNNTKNQDRLNVLAMLSVEKDLINTTENFNEQVIDLFAQNENRRMEFVYK